MVARLSALVIWALVAACAVFWGLRLTARPPQAPPYAAGVGDAVARGDLTRLFGAPDAAQPDEVVAPDAAARFQLLGVIAPKRGATDADDAARAPYGVALIAVDGQPPKAYKVGAALDDDLVLKSVGLRTAALGPAEGKAALTLELPILPPPSTGTLPAAVPAPADGAVRTPGVRALPPGLRRPGALPFQPGVPQAVQHPMPMPEPAQDPNEPATVDASPTPAD